MLVMTPILTFAAMMSGPLRGPAGVHGARSRRQHDHVLSPALLMDVPVENFWVGMSLKRRCSRLVLVTDRVSAGAREVGGDVGSLGKRTTASVVQAIFILILIDAICSRSGSWGLDI